MGGERFSAQDCRRCGSSRPAAAWFFPHDVMRVQRTDLVDRWPCPLVLLLLPFGWLAPFKDRFYRGCLSPVRAWMI